MKEILVVYYSQTGQLHDIVQNVVSGIGDDKINITQYRILPKKPFEFPWNEDDFMAAFPDSFLQIPHEIHEPDTAVLNKKYDLVILGHQVWFLSPSIPLNSFLKSNAAKKILHNTPVVTIIGARNMWYQSQEKVKRLLKACNAHLVGNIALTDRNINHISVITIEYWLLKGSKDRMWGVFPKPGVSDRDIAEAVKFGAPIKEAVLNGDFESLQNKLLAMNAVTIKPALIPTDKRGNIVFAKWAALITKKSEAGEESRKRWLGYFRHYLKFAIWVIAPIVFVVFLLTYIPFYRSIQKEKEYFSSVALRE